jgi:signal transduction histidine kinase
LKTAVLAFDEALVWWASEGPIEIRTTRRADALVVEVSRAGSSVTTEEASALFLPRRPGTGGGSKIGLYVVRGVAEALGGTAGARVEHGRLLLQFTLPVS